MKQHLSKQGNILAVTPESEDACVEQCVYRHEVVCVGVLGRTADGQTEVNLTVRKPVCGVCCPVCW